MTKQLTIRSKKDIEKYREKIVASAGKTQNRLLEMAENVDSMDLFYHMKFEEIGCDPFDATRNLNLIEQINQTFTYVASLKAAEYILYHHPNLNSLTLNLGTRSGWDIETSEIGGIVAEVFAAVRPENNRKLDKDIEKVKASDVEHRYVFFMCPGYSPGPCSEKSKFSGVKVVSLGCELV